MNIPEEFGNYLLLKKLREDALGETFRAGRVGRDGIEQVVLLRVFNGQGMEGEKLWQRISGRAAVQQALRSPNIGSGVDLGKVRSFPYAAYDYISGKNLATLFAQAARQRQSIPIDHALLITERLALALAAAYETRAQDERLLHGFVVPHLVMISNEGETRMLGFEVAPGLRDLWAGGWRNDDLRGYLAPEAAATAAVAKTDDVYSLGAILFELLASERLPLPLNGRGGPADGAAAYGPLAALIDGLILPNEGTPLPAAIAALLKKSLAPPDQRIADAVTWHKTISKLMIDGHYTSTTFNLAFFMHNLFRDEIDRESQEIEAEKKLELPPQRQVAGAGPAALAAGAAAGLAATHAGAAGAAEARERTAVRDAGWAAGAAAHAGGAGAGVPQFATAGAATSRPAGSDRKPLWIGLAAAALLLIGVGGYLLLGRGGAAAKPATQPGGAAGRHGGRERPQRRGAAGADPADDRGPQQGSREQAQEPVRRQHQAAAEEAGREPQGCGYRSGQGQDAKRAPLGERHRIAGRRRSGRLGRPAGAERTARAHRPDRAGVIGPRGRRRRRHAHLHAPRGCCNLDLDAPGIAARPGSELAGDGQPGGGRRHHLDSTAAAGRGRRRRTPAAAADRRPGADRPRGGHAQDSLPASDPLPHRRPAHEPVSRGHGQGAGRRAGEGREGRAAGRQRGPGLRRSGARGRPPQLLQPGDQGRRAGQDVDDDEGDLPP